MGKSKDLATGNSAFYQDQTESDARYVNTAGDAMTGNLTTTGNLGVGESSPNLGSSGTGLHIKGAASKDGVIKLDSQTADRSGLVQFTENGTDKWRIGYDAASNHLEFTRSGVADRMTITDDGYVLKPNQPMFAVKNTETANGYTQTYLQSWSTVQVNRGSHWNSSNGTFTAPVAGTYYFAWWVQEESYYGQWGGNINAGFYKNGSEYISFGNGGIADDASEAWFTMSALITLSANDYVNLRFSCNDTRPSFEVGQGQFYGYLIG